MKPLRLAISFFQLHRKDKINALIIIFLYLKVSYIVRCIPLKKYHHKFFQYSNEKPADLTLYKQDIRLILKVIKQLPGSQTCLKESIVVHLFFRRKGIKIPIYLGVSTKHQFSAHAWYNPSGASDYIEISI